MDYSNSARVVPFEELMESFTKEFHNPTVQRLLYIEALGKDNTEGKIFPCWLEMYRTDKEGKVDMFQITIAQQVNGYFELLRVNMKTDDIGKNKRFWDLPPTDDLRKSMPFATGVQ